MANPLPPIQNFVDQVGPVVSSLWLNAVDALLHSATPGSAAITANNDVFTTTANQTIFTLSGNAGTIGNLSVNLDGSSLTNGVDFTYNGSAVVLTTSTLGGQTLVAKYYTSFASTGQYVVNANFGTLSGIVVAAGVVVFNNATQINNFAAGAFASQEVILYWVGTGTLAVENGNSTGGQAFLLAGTTNATLTKNSSITFFWDGTYWVEQCRTIR